MPRWSGCAKPVDIRVTSRTDEKSKYLAENLVDM